MKELGREFEPVDPYQRLDHSFGPVHKPSFGTALIPSIHRPAVRRQRYVVVMATVAVTWSVLVLVMCGPNRTEFLTPGPLASVHAQVFKEHGSERCAGCHRASQADVSQWLTDLVTGRREFPSGQSHLCLSCHEKTISVATVTNPHTTVPEQLARITQQRIQVAQLAQTTLPPETNKLLRCSDCHREHQGNFHSLTAMTDNQCQSCHVRVFDRFEGNHPDFRLAMGDRTQKTIQFDHRTHFQKHFVEKNAEVSCQLCHQMDSQQRRFQVARFEDACAACHQNMLQNALAEGWTLLETSVTEKRLVETGVSDLEGGWFSQVEELEKSLSPVNCLLLLADPEVADHPALRDVNFDFADIDPKDSKAVQEANQLIEAMDRLSKSLLVKGVHEIGERLQAVTGRALPEEQLGRMFQGMPFDLGRKASESNQIEFRNFRFAGEKSSLVFSGQPLFSAQTDELLVANPLKGKSFNFSGKKELAAILPFPVQSVQAGNQEHHELFGLNSANRISEDDNQIQAARAVSPHDLEGEVLSANPLKGIILSSKQTTNTSGLTNNLDGTHVHDVPPKRSTAEKPEYPPVVKPFSLSTTGKAVDSNRLINNTGSWDTIGPSSLTLKYYPVVHADEVLVAWFQFAQEGLEQEQGPAKRYLQKLVQSPAFAECGICHQLFKQTDGAFSSGRDFRDSWRFTPERTDLVSFSKFSHRPHLLMGDCASCHELNLADPVTRFQTRTIDTEYAERSTGSPLGLPSSDFLPIVKANCANCHSQGKASHGCSDCHRYHLPATR